MRLYGIHLDVMFEMGGGAGRLWEMNNLMSPLQSLLDDAIRYDVLISIEYLM